MLDTKIDNNFNLDEGIKLLLELSKNEDYRKLILFCIISRLETVSNLEFFVLEHECRSTKNPLYEVLKENDVDFRNIIT